MNNITIDDDFIELPPLPSKPHKPTPTSPTLSSNNSQKREERRKQSGEDFTPHTLVNEMLDKLPTDLFTNNKTFLDPACGNCNFLIEILKRKLSLNINPLLALKSLYGTDIMQDNITEGRLRLLKVISIHSKTHNIKPSKDTTLEYIKTVGTNIVCTPLSTKYPNGSLDYDFSFSKIPTNEQAQKGLEKIINGKLLEQVSI